MKECRRIADACLNYRTACWIQLQNRASLCSSYLAEGVTYAAPDHVFKQLPRLLNLWSLPPLIQNKQGVSAAPARIERDARYSAVNSWQRTVHDVGTSLTRFKRLISTEAACSKQVSCLYITEHRFLTVLAYQPSNIRLNECGPHAGFEVLISTILMYFAHRDPEDSDCLQELVRLSAKAINEVAVRRNRAGLERVCSEGSYFVRSMPARSRIAVSIILGRMRAHRQKYRSCKQGTPCCQTCAHLEERST